MRVKLKKAVVIPANIQEVADRVAATPFDELASVLQDFKWSFDKGDLNHWVAVLDHFDSFLEQCVSQRSDVQMQGDVAAEDPPFPTEACLAVLSATCVLLENCSNKAAYNSSEHLSNLLAAPVPEVAAAALQTFQVLVRKTHHTSARWTPPAGLAQHLLSLSKGWGGKEEGLDLVVCASSDEAAIKKVLHKATTLHFEFSSSGAPAGAQAEGSSSRALTTIHVPNLDSFTEGEHQILAELVRRYKVPQAQRFELLCRIRIARGFGTLAGRRQLVKQRLLAFNVLLQCSPTAEEYNALYLAEPEFVSELVGLVQAEEAVPEEALRTLALRTLAAQLHDRSRISSVIAAVTSGGQSGLLSMLLHKSIASILQQADVPLAPSGSGVLPADVAASAAAAAAAAGPSSSGFAAAASSGGAAVPAAAAAAPPVGSVAYSVAFVDALLSVVAALVQSSSGYQALNDAGVVAALLPLMRDLHPEHLGLVCTNLRILEAYMDLSQSAATMFRDLGGLTEMIKRLAYEVGVLSPPSGPQEQSAAAAGAGVAGGARTAGDTDEVMASAEQPSSAGQPQQQGQAPAAAGGGGDAAAGAVPVKQLSHHRKVLLKYLLRIIAIGSYSPNGNVAPTRPQDDDAQLLFASLKAMYTRPEEFGGSLFSLAVSVMTDLIHHEPQSFRQLNEAGLPDAFLAAIKAGVLPSGDAVVSIPSALVALCLNTAGLKRVRETAVLNVLIDIFTSRKTQRVLTSDTPAVLGSGLEELLRFVPSLRGDGIDVVIGVFKALCILGGDEEEIAAALKPLPPEAPAEAEAEAAAATQPAAEPAASTAGSSGQQASAAAAAAAAEAPQPMDTDAPAAGAGAPAAAAGEQQAAAASGDAQQGAEAGADAAAGGAAGVAAAADGMDVDQPAAPAAQPDAADAAAPQQAAAEGAAAAEPAAAAAGDAAAAAPTTPAATAAAQQVAEREREREQQRLEDARLSAIAKRALAESLQAVTKRRDLDAEMDAFLPGALTAASRMLEPLLTNAETSRQFVERGGTDVLLKIYQLPKLTPQFNFSSASHSLLSVFRALSGTHGQAIAARSKDAVAQQVALLLPMAQAVGPVCVPLMAPEARDKYIKQVLVVQGLVALTSAVARNVTAMLPQVSMGSPPLLASMGKLERMVMVQVAASDPWKQARDVAKKAAAAAAAAGATDAAAAAGGAAEAAGAAAAGAAAPEAPVAAAEEAGPVGDADGADAAGAADDDMDGAAGDGAAAPEAADAPAAAVSAASPSKAKRPPEDIAYDGISFLLTSLRTFYMGTAKAVHSPARRREEQAAVPGVPMKAAALNLAALLVGNFQLQPWQQYDEAAEAKAGFAACGVSPPSSSKPGSERVEAAALVIRSRSGHYVRLTEELNQVLFDNRRRYCHLLVLNYFAALGGMKVFASAFHSAAAMLWELLDAEAAAAQAATQQGTAAATSDQTMTDVQPSTGGVGSSAAVAAVAAASPSPAAGSGPSASSLKDPRAVVEAVLVKMLAIYEQLANANMLLAVPQAVNMLLAPLPNYAGQPLVPPAKEPLHFVQQLHSDILAAVLPLWSHPQAAYVPAGVLTALVRVLQTCAQGPSHATLVLRYSQGRAAPAAARVQPQLDPALVQQIVDMGFSQARAEEALRRVGASSIELAMDWLFAHSEEPAAPAAPAAGEGAGAGGPANAAAAAAAEADREEEELTRALLASLSVVGMSPDAVVQRSQQQASAQQQQQPPAAGQPSDATVNTAEPGSPVASTAHTGADAAAAAAGAATPAAAGGAAAADADEVTTPQRTPVPVVQPGAPVLGVAPAAAAVGTAVEAAGESSAESASTGIPAPAQLVDGAIHLVAASPSAAFSIADLLVTMATCEDGKDRAALVARLMDECLPPSSSSSGEAGSSAAAAAAAEFPPPGKDVLTPARLLLLLLHKDQHSRRVAGSKGLSQRALSMLQGWQGKYSAGVAAYEQSAQQQQPGDASSLQVPVWVEAILLLLGMMATTQPKPSESRAQAGQARSREAAAAAARFDAEVAVQDAAARVFAAAVRRAAAGPGAAGEQDAQMAVDQPAAAAAAGPAATEQQPGGEAAAGPAAAGGTEAGAAAAPPPAEAAAAPAAGPAQAGGAAPAAAPAAAAGGGSGAGALPQELARLPGLDTVLDNWKPCGMLDDAQQQGAMSFGLRLLQQLHDHADKWEQADHSMYEADASLPNPGALTQALLQLLDHLTKRFCNAQLLLGAGGHRLLLSLPSACLSPTISRQEGSIGSILRHLLEDPSTLEGWMESEIKNSMALKGQHGMRDPYTGRSLYNQANPFSRYTSISAFLQMMSALVQREPAVFLQAVARTCTLDANRGESMIRLKSARELQQPLATQAAPASAPGASREGAAAAAAAAAGTSGAVDAAAPATAGEAAAEQPTPGLTTPKPAQPEQRDSGTGEKSGAAAPRSAAKPHKKLVPSNFVEVIDALLDVVMGYNGITQQQQQQQQQQTASAAAEPAAMELDAQSPQQQQAGQQGAAPATAAAAAQRAAGAAAAGAGGTSDTAPLPVDLLLRRLDPMAREVGIQALVLRLLGDYCLLYNNTVGLLLKRDSEVAGPSTEQRGHHHHQHHATPGPAAADTRTPASGRRTSSRLREHSSSGGQGGAESQHKAGVVLKHIMHVQLVDQLPPWGPSANSVPANASALLQAVCIRSAEGRRRILHELVSTLNSSIQGPQKQQPAAGAQDQAAASTGPLPATASACIALMGALVTSNSTLGGRSDPRQASSSAMSLEVVRAMREAGAVKALAQALKLINTEHAKARDAINAILKPLEVLTRPLHKSASADAAAAGAAAGEQAADTRTAPDQGTAAAAAAPAAAGAAGAAAAATAPSATPGTASRQRGQAAAAAAAGQPAAAGRAQGTAATGASAAAAAAAAAAAGASAAAGGAAAGAAQPAAAAGGSGGGNAPMDEDRRQQAAGEEAAGPAALAAAGRFVPGGVPQGGAGGGAGGAEGALLDNLMAQMVDIEVDLSGDSDGLDEDESEEDGLSSEEEVGSDEHMQGGMAGEEAGEEAAGGSSEGAGMDEDPSLTEEDDSSGDEPHSDDDGEGHPVFIAPGDVAGAHEVVDHQADGLDLDQHSDDSITDEDDEDDDEAGGHGGHHHAFDEEAALLEDELHLMQQGLNGAPQEDGVVPMDDEDEEDEEEEEEEYLDDEASDDQWAMDDTLATWGWEGGPGGAPPAGAGGSRWTTMHLQDSLFDDLPPLPSMRVDFGRLPGGRRMQGLRMGGTPSAAAGVWDDAGDGLDRLPDPIMSGPLGTVQMMLNQLGLQAGALAGSSDRRFRWMYPGGVDPSEQSAAATGASGAAADGSGSVRTVANLMQTLTSQLLPQQHRLLALPPRVAATESAALLEQAANLQPQRQQQQRQQQQPEGAAPAAPVEAGAAGAAAAAAGAAPADASLRSQAGTVSTLSRLVFRMNEAAAPSSNAYLRDGRISVRHPVSGGLINVAINPTLLSPGMGPGSSLWQTLEALSAPNGLLAAGAQGAGMGGLADDSVWDEAVTQLLEVLAPNGTGRSARLPTAGLAPPGAAGRAAAAGAADNAGLDPRSLESHMTALLRAQAPPAPAAAPEQPAPAAARRGQPVVPPAAAVAPAAGPTAAAAAAEADRPAGQAAAGTPQALAPAAAPAAAGSDRDTRTPSPSQQAGQPQPPPAPSAIRARAAAQARPTGTQPAAAGPSAAAAAGGAAAARRPAAITEDFLANALRAALDGDTAARTPAAAGAAAQPADGAGPSGAAQQQQQQQHDAAVQRLASHPLDVATSAGGSPTAAGAAAAAAGGPGADKAAPMDTDAEQQQAGAGEPDQAAGGGPTAMEAEPSAGATAAPAAAGDPMQAALRRAAEEAGIDWAFLEALPEELRVEVLSAQGVELLLPQPAGALPAAAAAPPAAAEPAAAAAAPAAGDQPASQQAATAEAAAAGEAPAPAAAAAGEGGAAAAAAGDAPAPAAAAADADGGAAPAAAAAAAAPAPAAAAPPEEPEIDPEFLAALPDDIRQEVLAQQRAEQRARAAAARAAEQNRQPDMSLADLLAAMPDDVRQDALAQLSDTDLAQLPPQTRAEAVALRENAQRAMRQMQAAQQAQQQAAQQQHEMFLQQNLPGGAGRGLRLAGAPPLSLAVGPDGLPVAARMFGTGGLRAALGNAGRLGGRDLASATAAARAANAAAEPEGPPPLDESDLAVLISLLRTSLPLSKQHLQKLFLNLAAHSSSREQLLSMLLSLLRSLPGTSAVEGGTDADAAPDEASDSMQTGTSGRAAGMDISEDASSQQQQQQQPSQGLSAALDKLGSAQEQTPAEAGGAGSASPAADGAPGTAAVGLSGSPQGKPAVVSRRVLDMLSYLCRNSSPVSRKMLSLRIPEPDAQAAALEADAKGKGKMVVPSSDADTAAPQAPRAVEVLLAMLSAPLCQRSVSLLEQLMLLMEVVLTMVARHEADLAALAALEEAQEQQREAEAERKRQREQQQQQAAAAAAEQPAAAGAQPAEQPAAAAGAAAEPGQQQEATRQAAGAAEPAAAQQQQQDQSSIGAEKAKEQEQQDKEKQQKQKQKQKQQQPPSELATTLACLPPNLLRQLPGLLAREVLSEPAYASIAKVIKLIVEAAPVHLPLMLSELVEGAAGVADALLSFLDTAAQRGIDADAQLAPAIGTKSSVVLRMLYALQGFQAEVQERLKQQKEQQQQEAASAGAAAGTASGAAGAATAATGSSGAVTATAGPSSSRAAAARSAGASSSAAAAGTAGLDASGAAAEVDKAVASIAARTAPLWKSLSSCILRIEDNLRAVLPQHTQAGGESVGSAAARLLPPGAQQVLPLVEAFFVLCALQGAIPAAAAPAKDLLSAPSMDLNALMPSTSSGGAAGAAAAGTPSAGGTAAAGGGAASGLWRPSSMSLGEAGASTPGAAAGGDGTLPFLKFAERHRRLLNAYIRRNTSLLESSLAPLLRVPKLIDFDNKRAYFRSKVRSPDERTYGSLRLHVKRTSVFEDSFNKLRSKSPAEMRAKLSVAFVGEEGIDAGGVSREWYQVMAREIFNPNLALFVSVPEGGTTFQPNPNSIVQNDTGVSHLEFFKFVGRVVGKALYDGQLMDAYFTRSFYKHMLGQPLTYEDIEAVDPEYYKNLKWMLENDITDVLDLTFTAESDFFGKTEVVELVPGGRDIRVTEANKREYVNLIARHRMTTSIKAQIQAFLEGFWQLVPRELIAIFNDHELELLISGLPDIDVADLRSNTQYSGYSPASTVIQWFWQVVADMEKQDLALLLQFVTGTSKVPLNGFKALQGISGPQRFQIHKSYGAGDRLPSAHTCFNQLDLPEYDSKEQLAERLMMAIHEGHEGFGFG